ncbi:unnamed protein product, partial [Vitis vinifera]|uniref:Uncharacterized protein n=1 Tax=Vitis vinifera TaxID=29760 RepID=D7TKY4_VITVI
MRNIESFTIGVIEFTIEAFHQECFIKLRQPSPNAPLSCKSQGSTSNQYFIIKDNQNMYLFSRNKWAIFVLNFM